MILPYLRIAGKNGTSLLAYYIFLLYLCTHNSLILWVLKLSKQYSTLSLSRFREKYSQRIGGSYIIHPKNLKDENGVLYLPAYMAFCL